MQRVGVVRNRARFFSSAWISLRVRLRERRDTVEVGDKLGLKVCIYAAVFDLHSFVLLFPEVNLNKSTSHYKDCKVITSFFSLPFY